MRSATLAVMLHSHAPNALEQRQQMLYDPSKHILANRLHSSVPFIASAERLWWKPY